jgi:DNA polymerase-3 subunit alpha
MSFIHLKTETEFSINQGLNRIDDLVEKAVENNMGALAITDLNGMFGSINFYKECRSNGIKPIIGVDLTVEQPDGTLYQLTLLAKNQNGYKSLISVNSKAYTENRKADFAPVKEEWLGELVDVIVLSGAKQGLIGKKILEGKTSEALEFASELKGFFGDDFYIELQRDGSPEETTYMDGAIEICQKLNIPPVATHPVLFKNTEDFVAHETRYCVGHAEPLYSLKRKKLFNKEMYFKSNQEMEELFEDIPQALSNTVAIAKKCNIQLELDKPQLPHFPTPNGEDANTYFANIARKGLVERLEENFPNEKERESVRKKYEERLEVEIGIIQKMGFPGYFLIVSDFITWAKEQDIPVGPGRGSGAGSLVAYSMKITDLDPLPYNLLFERFLNPDRVSMPDFDIDFCQSRRNEVYEYVRQKYGEDAVSQIGTFGTMAAKAVVRDVGRALTYSYDFVDTLAKMININPAKPITLKEFIFGKQDKDGEYIINPDEKLLNRYNNEPDVKKLIDIGLKLEGITKQVGTHAAGVVIAPTKLTDFTPLYTLDSGSAPSSQFAKDDVETAGLVKFDFLGLRNLTIIKEAVDLVNEKMKISNQPEFNLRRIPLDDATVYKHIFAEGNTTGIFQFEGSGMTAVLQKANPESLGDLIAINALYRPGPMEIIPEWLASKNLPEEQRQYPHPSLRDMLKETYGYMIYQEQVMQCAQIIAGYSLGGADLLRRAMGKKKPEEMAKQRQIFVEGAAKNKVDASTANGIFDLMEKFSGYGFNKSHAAAYSYVAYQTAYLKTYFPDQFLTANLNSHIGTLDTDKIAILANDAKNNGIKLLPPDVNSSGYVFKVENEGEIRYGLGAIKGVGEKAALTIEKERLANGPYTDFYNFLERAGRGNVNKRVMEALVKAGVFDSLNNNRAQLFTAVAEGLDYVDKFRKKQMENVSVLGDSIFDDAPVAPKKTRAKKVVEVVKPELPTVDAWDDLTSIKNEKAAMGYFFSSNPYNTYYTRQLDGFDVATKLADIKDKYDEGYTDIYVGALIEDINWWKSKKGAFVRITDGTTTAEVSMFADFLNDNKEWLRNDSFVSLKLRLQPDDSSDSPRMTVNQGFSFEQTKKLITSKVFVGSENEPEKLRKFEEICEQYICKPEDSDVTAILCVPGANGRRNQKARTYTIKPEQKLVDDLTQEFGSDWVKEIFKKDIDNIAFPEVASKKGNKKNYQKTQKRGGFSV